jgi:signal transduction histidine kinase
LVELSQLDDAALIEVLDQGIGIPAADLPHVFDRFYRGSNISPAVGSGLGLSVVRLLVEAMGGSISVSSEPGQGSCFRMRFSLC